jgi:flagellar biogenesis protein FliO
MQFLTSLFGGSENTFVTAILALGIVLVLIVLGLWALKVFFRASNTFVRGRNKRLTVVDQVAIDQKRQLIIVRRDNVEHLLLVGGPQDVVVESGIAAEKPSAGVRRPSVGPTATAPAQAPAAAAAASPQPAEVLETSRTQIVPPPAPRAAIERLRDLARPSIPRRPDSLRHTGLMRPVTRMEAAVIPMNPDGADHRRVDSAKAAPQSDVSEQAKVGGGSYPVDGVKAEGN